MVRHDISQALLVNDFNGTDSRANQSDPFIIRFSVNFLCSYAQQLQAVNCRVICAESRCSGCSQHSPKSGKQLL